MNETQTYDRGALCVAQQGAVIQVPRPGSERGQMVPARTSFFQPVAGGRGGVIHPQPAAHPSPCGQSSTTCGYGLNPPKSVVVTGVFCALVGGKMGVMAGLFVGVSSVTPKATPSPVCYTGSVSS